jgi:hypothetical protein
MDQVKESTNMPESATAISATGQTGGLCRQSGPYRSTRNARVVIFVRQGSTFPTDADGAGTTWSLVTDSG